MSYPKTLRNYLGISTEVFSDLIQCGVGHLYMVEAGKRSLPAASLLQVSLMEKAVAQIEPLLPAAITPSAKEIALAEKYRRSCQLMADTNKEKLELLEKKHEQALRLLMLCQAFEATPFLPDQGEAHLQMKILKRKTEKKVDQLKEEWMNMKFIIAGLQAQIALAEEIKNV